MEKSNSFNNSNEQSASQLSQEERYGKASLMVYKTDFSKETIDEFMKLEDEGFTEASIALGQFAQAFDDNVAFAHFKKAADAGSAEGAWSCAAIIGHSKNPDFWGKDKEWYDFCLKAAKGGCCDAMNELGNAYNRKDDYLAAFYWYNMATWYEHPEGVYGVEGTLDKWSKSDKPALSESINGVSRVEVGAAKYAFRVSIGEEQLTPQKVNELMILCLVGSEFMPLFLGHFFEDVIKSDKLAKTYYQVAGHNHSIMGMKCIGDMLAYGKGCTQDMDKAYSWFRAAANADEKTACFIMGEYYRMSNKYLAAYWYAKAARRGYDAARVRMLAVL